MHLVASIPLWLRRRFLPSDLGLASRKGPHEDWGQMAVLEVWAFQLHSLPIPGRMNRHDQNATLFYTQTLFDFPKLWLLLGCQFSLQFDSLANSACTASSACMASSVYSSQQSVVLDLRNRLFKEKIMLPSGNLHCQRFSLSAWLRWWGWQVIGLQHRPTIFHPVYPFLAKLPEGLLNMLSPNYLPHLACSSGISATSVNAVTWGRNTVW